MCLDHVYIVLGPVGSARLMFDDDLYYELCVLMTKVCSESRMRSHKDSYIGRLHSDTGMDRVVSDKFRSTGGYWNPPREVIGPHGPSGGREEAGQGVARTPLARTKLY